MTTAIPLDTAITEYLASRQSKGMAANTLRSDKTQLTRLLAHTGNIHVRTITDRHIDSFFSSISHQKASSRNLTRQKLTGFFKWCRQRHYLSHDPLTGRDRLTEHQEEAYRVPVWQFPDLLDAAPQPRDRVVVAIGLYLFLRSSEIKTLRISDVDLGEGTIRVTIHKTDQVHTMDICAELDAELRTWLQWYMQHLEGPLTDDMYLVPTTKSYRAFPGPDGKFVKADGRVEWKVFPHKPMARPHEAVQRALAGIGVPTLWQGGHTLRRSGARAFYDEEIKTSKKALRTVKTMLHHAHESMTEHYIGVDEDKQELTRRLRGKPMFAPREVTEWQSDPSETVISAASLARAI